MQIKWQSKLFPKLILTEEHYQEMRKDFPEIESFRDQMEKLEKHLKYNPGKVPRSHWKTKISNWMIVANEIAKEKRAYRLRKGMEKQHFTKNESSQALASILGAKSLVEEKAVKKPFTCERCGQVHHPKFDCRA